MWYFCHAQLFETTHAENIKSPLGQHSCRNAKVVEAFCEADYRPSTRYSASLHAHMHVVWVCRCAHDRGHRSHAISIALAALPAPNFPRLRALALFGRRPPEREEPLVIAGVQKPAHNQTHALQQNTRATPFPWSHRRDRLP